MRQAAALFLGSAVVVIAASAIAAKNAGNRHVGSNGELPIADTRIRLEVGSWAVCVSVHIGYAETGSA